ncbi:RidA family protein [Planosporangium flavigriseum]|uniref:Reactive intermediate/imine deaminase n=1 Tax=Planosporangium flavigriseum TaxID=373681 RepID=A0A8J3PKP7_9ACTN|nr:RidA family protein [Planosporangium flavigriseum]NJC65752.1 RidA family protein [Planosporangium flavigriseum]GIG73606.1 reactive intermediate/imine deaminase [Planosporangium flavigriseum]
MPASIRIIPHADGQDRPYQAATVHGGVVYPCGQVPVRTDGVVPADFAEQVTVCLDNLERVLHAAGSDLDHLLQLTVYLADLADFDAYNAAYLARLRGRPLPPRTTVQVAGFRGGKRIEISAIAAVASADQGS